MSVTQNLGKVAVTPKGAWSATTAYDILDVVTSGGSSYMAKTSVPAGTALSDTAYWMVIASKGDTGATPDLSAYRTATQQDAIDSGKQTKITASGILQGDGSGGVTAKPVDATPTASSANLVTSGGVASGLSGKVNYTDKLSSITGAMSDAEKVTVFSRQSIIKTALDSVLVPLANYFLGEQSNLTLTLPTTGMSAGQTIIVVFYSNTTATTLNIVGDFLGDSPTISANQRAELNFLYDGVYWMLLSNVVAVPQDEVSV